MSPLIIDAAVEPSVPYNLRVPGQCYVAETGLNQNYFRDYDPQVGRYVESDPIGLKGGINPYGYATQNPVSLFDQTGLNPAVGTLLDQLFHRESAPSSSCPDVDCEEQAQKDEEVCRSLPNVTDEQKAVRSRCWQSANERFGACRAKRPLPPLVTWRQAMAAPPPTFMSGNPAPPPWWMNGVLLFLVPWPGNPVYAGF